MFLDRRLISEWNAGCAKFGYPARHYQTPPPKMVAFGGALAFFVRATPLMGG